ncbi:13968_t:CDS:2, partial [Dentiscutata heterogama]
CDLKSLLEEKNPVLDKGICKFVRSYKKYQSAQDTYIRPAHGDKEIKVQVAAATRHKKESTHNLKKMPQG